MVKEINIGLLGLGTVGSGVVTIIENHQDRLMHQIGCPVRVSKVLVRNLEKERTITINTDLLTTNPDDIIDNSEIDIVVEVIGGIEDTKDLILRALKNKKHVVTANKDLIALHGAELLTTAIENKCDLFYEASVAGGIPILRGLTEGLASDRITKMMGIVNGTTNFILTKMTQEGRDYDSVLKEAQKLGFAESDPTADVEGFDAARKMAILATLGFSMNIDLNDISVKGISSITSEDIEYAMNFGYIMKLIGLAQREGDMVSVTVEPMLLPHIHPLASVHNEYNAVFVTGEAVGETMFYGPGAGSLPTATSVVSDLVAVMKNMQIGVNGRMNINPQLEKSLLTDEQLESKYFLRIVVKDEIGVFSQITSLFTKEEVSLEKILQHPSGIADSSEIIIVTHKANKKSFNNIINTLNEISSVIDIKGAYPIVGEDKK
ncbi:MAG: homoserine dehydrogenase [Bacillales bacterium]|jgi:homoserine dehydrogenase|nr:homoserine dehydrogenase [Bacillales bacterium]